MSGTKLSTAQHPELDAADIVTALVKLTPEERADGHVAVKLEPWDTIDYYFKKMQHRVGITERLYDDPTQSCTVTPIR